MIDLFNKSQLKTLKMARPQSNFQINLQNLSLLIICLLVIISECLHPIGATFSSLYSSVPILTRQTRTSTSPIYHYPPPPSPFAQHSNQHYSQYRRREYGDSFSANDEVNFSLSQEEYGRGKTEPGAGTSTEDNSGYRENENDNLGESNGNTQRLPEFVSPVPNVTVQVGREARLPCIVRNLATYRTAWIRDEEKSILTLQRQMVTRDPRITLLEESQLENGPDFTNQQSSKIRYFVLIIRNVQFSDRGGYMCQVNTVPMISQIGHLHVVVPPDIIDHESSNDVMAREGENVTLKCKARGHPDPEIEWRREDGNRVPLGDRNNGINGAGNSNRRMANKTEGEILSITRVTRVHSGAWLCIASNGVMPSVSRRILLNVKFAPQIWIPSEEIGAPFGSNITLDCHIEAYPLPLNYWTFGLHSESIYISGPKYEVSVKEKGYKRHLKLTIQRLAPEDLGLYKCHAQNSLGRQVKQVRIYANEVHKQTESKPQMVLINGPNTPLHSSLNGHNKKNEQNLFNGKLKTGNNVGPGNPDRALFKKKKRKKKVKLLDSSSNDKLMMTNNDQTNRNTINNDLSYNVIKSFSNDGNKQIKTSMENGDPNNNIGSGLNNEKEDETENEDDFESLYDNEYDDYYNNTGHVFIPIDYRIWLTLLLIQILQIL